LGGLYDEGAHGGADWVKSGAERGQPFGFGMFTVADEDGVVIEGFGHKPPRPTGIE
jgi:hypothetical protein